MTYEEALEFICNTQKFGMKPGLHTISELLERMDNPQKKLRYIHIAGTNGKGSTAAFISSILMESGYKTGIFTSPHIQRVTERIKVNNAEIEQSRFAGLTELIQSKIKIMLEHGGCHPTEFEILTAMAFQYFYEQGCNVVVLEVGLGGRLDSTNVIDTPDLGVITAVSYDHMNILGNTIQEIAAEKAGIIKRGGDIVAYSNPPSVTAIIEKACREKGAKLHRTDFSGIKIIEQNMEGQTFSYKQYTALKISLLGEHQVKNAAVAVHVAEVLKNKGYNITEKAIRKGLLKARWPGRLEVLSKNPFFLIDGAHNAEGVAALKKSLDSLFPGQALTFIMGVLGDKDYQSMLAEILPGCAKLFTVTPNSGRALSAADLAKAAKEYCKNIQICDTVGTAVKKSLVETPKGGAICAFGSLFYIGEVRSILK
ncbi:Folylpolyglutamate synthase [Caprobacter fermentans]|uniref:tetrahydrofolate synthase n=1 Tax=Caproicibacter fermentans TaxID=2576756 RepID=A0A6N8I1S3_9FIRM|nr:folylpolyglutamate synthase/dihydrofolate synthase family protein [Caproicibacter fermentans]MVB12034.1 Folylpolyglutamate synthase [Caproicibacter fermentans]